MEFKEQMTDIELVIEKTPRVYVQWKNTMEGYSHVDRYERFAFSENGVFYVNAFNRSFDVHKGDPFFETLEQIYNEELEKQNQKVADAETENERLFKEYDFIIASFEHGTSAIGQSKEALEHHDRIVEWLKERQKEFKK